MNDNKPIKIKNPIQNYAWGSTDFIPELMGICNQEQKPFAELWMGAHPNFPSTTNEGKPLNDIISESKLGLTSTHSSANEKLPYLFKVLSAASPLSLQVHPDKNRAEEGFHRENDARIPIDGFNRNYKDNNHKPEIICALTPFWAMKGFRFPRAIYHLIEESQAAQLLELSSCLNDDSISVWDRLSTFFNSLLSLSQGEKKSLLLALLTKTKESENPIFLWIARLADFYPGDIGVLAPLYLNLIHLKPGEALYLGPGVLHSYLEGTGLELMADSDNILRGGLTSKFIDINELLKTVLFDAEDPEILHPIHQNEEWLYETPSREFSLSKICLKGEAGLGSPITASILFCVGGSGEMEGQFISKGEALFIPYRSRVLRLKGEGLFYRASIPV